MATQTVKKITIILLADSPLGKPGRIVEIDAQTAIMEIGRGRAHAVYGPGPHKPGFNGPPQIK